MPTTISSSATNPNGGRPQAPAWVSELNKLKLDPRTREAVRGAVSAAAIYKGYPFSQTEFGASTAMIRDELEKQNGEKAALAFDKVLEKVPVNGGRFNPWSGD